MALTKSDKEWMAATIDTSVTRAIDRLKKEVTDPLRKDVSEVRQTVYGVNMTNGLQGDTKCLFDGLDEAKVRITAVEGAQSNAVAERRGVRWAMSIISGIVGGALAFGAKVLIK